MPVGSVEFCRSALVYQGTSEPAPIDYPECLREYLAGCPELMAWGDVPPHHHTLHIKPYQTKLDRSELAPETQVWVIDKHRFTIRVAFLCLRWKDFGSRQYEHGDCLSPQIDAELVHDMMVRFQASGEAPRGYAIDVGVSASNGSGSPRSMMVGRSIITAGAASPGKICACWRPAGDRLPINRPCMPKIF